MGEDLIGKRLGRYEVLEPISTAHHAQVYRARQVILDRDVTLKALALESEDPAPLRHFYDEARIVARLAHPHIVPVHDFGEEHGWAYIVMEYVAGGTVRDRIGAAQTKGQPLDLSWTLQVGWQAASALAYAHEQGVVHRDVKPANMLLRASEFMLLSDFGIALLADSDATPGASESLAGTPHYMAPEQAIAGATVDGRADIYALGASLYQCVTGSFPFVGESAVELLAKHTHEPLIPPTAVTPGLPERVEYIIEKAMAKDPAQRYQHISEMAGELRQAREDLRATGRHMVPNFAASGLRAPTSVPLPRGEGKLCARCGEKCSTGHRFCTRCGYDFDGSPTPLPPGILPARLVFLSGPLALAASGILISSPSVTLGRGSANDLIITERSVSRARHARLFTAYGGWFVEDVGSSRGTYLNDDPVTTPREVIPGDTLRFGDVIARFEAAE